MSDEQLYNTNNINCIILFVESAKTMHSKTVKCKILLAYFQSKRNQLITVFVGAWLQLNTGRILKLPRDFFLSHNRRKGAIA